ncbi:unnamed protein product [Rhizophagus irregularis]|uniref:Phytocyanin domain-containing protein n=1 Tax=Rhizophagus irregularis TaxID=588596 RepID=A0A2I1G2D9_9GLOM|nr:hypothetical protein RhiirA4_495711 [Rhizophagus irregularis]CAB4417675.1 unnamed protein product [Rhizophagus irregularis]
MNKIFAVYLFLLGLIIYVHAADVMVNVGNAKGENVFEPANISANPGDNVVFTWISGKHNVIETDSLIACTKSAKPDAFYFADAYTAPYTWTLHIPHDAAVGKIWFYCGVPGHCIPGNGGMTGTLSIWSAPIHGPAPNPISTHSNDTTTATSSSKAAPSNETMPGANSPSNNNTSNTPNMVGAIIGSLIGGSLLTIGSFLLYKKFKNYNKNKNVLLVPGDSKNNFNSGGQVHNNTEGYNHGQEATTISVNENQVHNDTNVYNYGQETITILENNDNNNLKDYITQIVRQELTQNQKKQ